MLGAVAVGTAAVGMTLTGRAAHSSAAGDATAHALTFDLVDAPIGRPFPPPTVEVAVSTHGSVIATWGDGTVAIDDDSGELVRLDAAGAVTARLAIAPGAGRLAVDRRAQRIYVADRANDRIAVVRAPMADDAVLERVGTAPTPAEPFGVALTPDGKTLLVTCVADRALTAIDTTTRRQRWSVDIGPEPRGVAVSFDGTRALVTYLQMGAVARVDLTAGPSAPTVKFSPLPAGRGVQTGFGGGRYGFGAAPVSQDGVAFARNAFDVAFVGHDLAVVAHQSSMPGADASGFEDQGTYGGGEGPPIAYRLAFVGRDTARRAPAIAIAEIGDHQPRAVAYDAARDILYVAGFGSDTVSAVGDVSQAGVRGQWQLPLAIDGGCGPTGLDVRPSGDVVVFCALSRQVVTVRATAEEPARAIHVAAAVTKSRLSAEARQGRELFRRGNSFELSGTGAMACAACHPEGRNDGLSWRIEGKRLQTPLLGGRMVDTHPFKWDGGDADLSASLFHTVRRLGGSGITPEQVAALRAYVESLPRPRRPTVVDSASVARGEALFASASVGCASCHSGENFTNRKPYDLADDLERVDTPSLVGLAASAPYYHDGSAATLEAVLLENGSVHGMGDVGDLSDTDVRDLTAYLLTL